MQPTPRALSRAQHSSKGYVSKRPVCACEFEAKEAENTEKDLKVSVSLWFEPERKIIAQRRRGMSICPCLCSSMYLTDVSMHPSTYSCMHLPVHLSMYLPTGLSIYLSVHLSICASIHLSVYLPVCLAIYLSIYLICPFVYLLFISSFDIYFVLSFAFILSVCLLVFSSMFFPCLFPSFPFLSFPVLSFPFLPSFPPPFVDCLFLFLPVFQSFFLSILLSSFFSFLSFPSLLSFFLCFSFVPHFRRYARLWQARYLYLYLSLFLSLSLSLALPVYLPIYPPKYGACHENSAPATHISFFGETSSKVHAAPVALRTKKQLPAESSKGSCRVFFRAQIESGPLPLQDPPPPHTPKSEPLPPAGFQAARSAVGPPAAAAAPCPPPR